MLRGPGPLFSTMIIVLNDADDVFSAHNHSPSLSPAPRKHKAHNFSRSDLTESRLYPQAIRKKIENELARKRTISTNNTQRRPGKKQPAAKGSVAALKPSPALTVPEGITVSDASQLCAAKRTDCVLVVDEEEGLSGIFTAKDLAYRVCLFDWLKAITVPALKLS